MADLATELERQLTTGKRAERTKHDFRCVPNLPLCHWPSQLFDLRAPSSTDVPVLLLNQPFFIVCHVVNINLGALIVLEAINLKTKFD